MEIFNILAIIICVIICLIFAPFITIGFIFINSSSLGVFGDVIGTLFIIIGIARMLNGLFSND